jgi:hypothetical protein
MQTQNFIETCRKRDGQRLEATRSRLIASAREPEAAVLVKSIVDQPLSTIHFPEMARRREVDASVEDIIDQEPQAPPGKTPRRRSPSDGQMPEADENSTMTPAEAITEDAISRRAYELYERRGREDGRHEEDWQAAERELRESRR